MFVPWDSDTMLGIHLVAQSLHHSLINPRHIEALGAQDDPNVASLVLRSFWCTGCEGPHGGKAWPCQGFKSGTKGTHLKGKS